MRRRYKSSYRPTPLFAVHTDVVVEGERYDFTVDAIGVRHPSPTALADTVKAEAARLIREDQRVPVEVVVTEDLERPGTFRFHWTTRELPQKIEPAFVHTHQRIEDR